MPHVSLLKIGDEIIGPHLQLLRIVCEPRSTSTPHVTVRYFDRLSIPREYTETKVTYIDLVEPGMFLDNPKASSAEPQVKRKYTVFIRCKSDDLTPLEHKPDFPESDFHITIYDGPSRRFARRLLADLKRFSWAFRVPLPADTVLTIKEVNSARSRSRTPRVFGGSVLDLYLTITSKILTVDDLMPLSDDNRLIICRLILKHLSKSTSSLQRVSSSRRPPPSRKPKQLAEPELPEVHLTPPELAQQIAVYAVRQLRNLRDPIDFGDPAVGTGAFYAALLQVVKTQRIASAIGVDINSDQVAAARWRWSDKGMEVLKGDYLHMESLPKRTLILANPPYLRHQSIPSAYKQRLRERASLKTDIKISARSGLYVYFLLLSHEWMAQDAIAAWLIPSEFMNSVYGVSIRQYLTENVELLHIHNFGADVPQFEKVLVSASVVVFRNRRAIPEHTAVLSSGGRLDSPEFQQSIRIQVLRSHNVWSIPLREERVTTFPSLRIKDFFTVRRGIATGANAFFVLPRGRAIALGLPDAVLKPIMPKAKTLITDIIERAQDGYPIVEPQMCVIDCALPMDQLQARFPTLADYLGAAAPLGVLEHNLVRHRNPWYKQETRRPPMFLCTYMGRGSLGIPPIRFIWNKSQAIALNNYLLLYPLSPLADALTRNPALGSSLFTTLQDAAQRTVIEHARVRAGGLHKIEPRELLEVRLDAPPAWLSELGTQQLSLALPS